ncbi:MAG: hypothetical protein QXW98_06065 [Candidatus Caldarchaeum sp.]
MMDGVRRIHTVHLYADVEMFAHKGNGYCNEISFNTKVHPILVKGMEDKVSFRIPYPPEEVEVSRVSVTVVFGKTALSYAFHTQYDGFTPTGAKVWNIGGKSADIEPISGVQLVRGEDNALWLQIDIPQVIQTGKHIGENLWEEVSTPLPPLPEVEL